MIEYISNAIRDLSILSIPVLTALTLHEVAHGWTAYVFGDNTAKKMGRLSLNPLKHLDLMGTLAFIITRMIGWAKPVPVNPMNFKNPRKDMVWVALAGPGMNVILALISSFIFKLFPQQSIADSGGWYSFFLLPVSMIIYYSILINVAFAIFNCIPLPPLDGGRIVYGLLPEKYAEKYGQIERYGFVILMILIFSGIIRKIIFPIINVVFMILV